MHFFTNLFLDNTSTPIPSSFREKTWKQKRPGKEFPFQPGKMGMALWIFREKGEFARKKSRRSAPPFDKMACRQGIQ